MILKSVVKNMSPKFALFAVTLKTIKEITLCMFFKVNTEQ